jgi:hypothetical protein
VSLLVILLLLILALSVLLVVPRKESGRRRSVAGNTEDIDEDVLAQAEAELEDVRSTATPEEADDELPDWGPGVPKRPRGPPS